MESVDILQDECQGCKYMKGGAETPRHPFFLMVRAKDKGSHDQQGAGESPAKKPKQDDPPKGKKGQDARQSQQDQPLSQQPTALS